MEPFSKYSLKSFQELLSTDTNKEGVDLSGSNGTYDGGLVASTGTKFSTSTWQRPPAQLVEHDEAPFTGTVGTYTVNYLSFSSDTSDHIVFGSINEVVNSAYTSSANYRGGYSQGPAGQTDGSHFDGQAVIVDTVDNFNAYTGAWPSDHSQLLPVLCKI